MKGLCGKPVFSFSLSQSRTAEKIIIGSHSLDSVLQLLSLGVTSVAQAKAILHIIFSVR